MRIHDITRTLGSETPPYPGDATFERVQAAWVPRDGYNISRLSMSSHSGTHVDAPRHFFDEGKSLDRFPIERFCLDALVAEVEASPVIEARDLEGIDVRPGEALILKTPNGRLPVDEFREDFVYLSAGAAEWVVERGVALLGIDYYSVDAFTDDAQTAHHILLAGDDMLIVENLDLREAAPGRYRLICLPLKMDGADGAPCRAVLIEDD